MIDHTITLQKPKLGEKCNGCGICCTLQPCLIAQTLLDCVIGPCVALERDENRTYCGLLRRPEHYLFGKDISLEDSGKLSCELAFMLGVGQGCDSDD